MDPNFEDSATQSPPNETPPPPMDVMKQENIATGVVLGIVLGVILGTVGWLFDRSVSWFVQVLINAVVAAIAGGVLGNLVPDLFLRAPVWGGVWTGVATMGIYVVLAFLLISASGEKVQTQGLGSRLVPFLLVGAAFGAAAGAVLKQMNKKA